jgi:hypothetical protein
LEDKWHVFALGMVVCSLRVFEPSLPFPSLLFFGCFLSGSPERSHATLLEPLDASHLFSNFCVTAATYRTTAATATASSSYHYFFFFFCFFGPPPLSLAAPPPLFPGFLGPGFPPSSPPSFFPSLRRACGLLLFPPPGLWMQFVHSLSGPFVCGLSQDFVQHVHPLQNLV